MDKNFVIAYELTAETTTRCIDIENTPIKFLNIKHAKDFLQSQFPKGCTFQLMIIGKEKTIKFKVK